MLMESIKGFIREEEVEIVGEKAVIDKGLEDNKMRLIVL
jgi:hypothetical protein